MKRNARNESLFIGLVHKKIFEIDAGGRIWRTGHFHTRQPGRIVSIGRKRAENKDSMGYLRVTARTEGKQRFCKAHRLVWTFFFGIIPGGMEVNHKDGNKSNNNPANLELLTPSQNVKHAYRKLKVNDRRGENNTFSKLKNSDVVDIRRSRKCGQSVKDIARRHKVGISAIYRVISGNAWSHT